MHGACPCERRVDRRGGRGEDRREREPARRDRRVQAGAELGLFQVEPAGDGDLALGVVDRRLERLVHLVDVVSPPGEQEDEGEEGGDGTGERGDRGLRQAQQEAGREELEDREREAEGEHAVQHALLLAVVVNPEPNAWDFVNIFGGVTVVMEGLSPSSSVFLEVKIDRLQVDGDPSLYVDRDNGWSRPLYLEQERSAPATATTRVIESKFEGMCEKTGEQVYSSSSQYLCRSKGLTLLFLASSIFLCLPCPPDMPRLGIPLRSELREAWVQPSPWTDAPIRCRLHKLCKKE